MALLSSTIINSRADLEALIGTPQHQQFMEFLRGSMVRRQNVATYPDGYGLPEYEGPVIDPVWEDVEDLSTIERFGFTKADFTP